MSRKSQFQLLPWPILRNIYQYTTRYVNYYKSRSERLEKHSTCRSDLVFTLCPEWTILAIDFHYKRIDITLSKDGIEAKCVPYALFFNPVPVHVYLVVKEASITIDVAEIISGQTIAAILQSEYASAVLGNVKTLQLNLSVTNACLEIEQHAHGMMLTEVFYRLKQVMPNIAKSTLTIKSVHACNDVLVRRIGKAFERHMCTGVTHTYLDLDLSRIHTSLPVASISELTRLTISTMPGCIFNAKVIQESAATLKSLSLNILSEFEVVRTLTDENGVNYCFPELEKLLISGCSNMSTQAKFSSFIRFPALQYLEVLGDYQFNDDVLFRGNTHSLTHVNLTATMHLVDICQKYSVFGSNKRPNLRRVRIERTTNEFDYLLDEPRKFANFVMNAAQSALSLIVCNKCWEDDLPNIIAQEWPVSKLQVIDIGDATLDLDELFGLIASLPSLCQLSIGKIEIEDIYWEMTPVELLNYMMDRINPLSNTLQFLRTSSGSQSDNDDDETGDEDYTTDNVTCAILLALLCPRFTRFVEEKRWWELFNSHLAETLKYEPYRNHAGRLCHLALADLSDHTPGS